MNELLNKLILLDFEIQKTLMKKKQLDYYLAELYELREDTFVEYENSQNHTCNGCKK